MNETVNRLVSKLLTFCILLSAILSNIIISFADDNIRQPTQPMTITVGKGDDKDFNSIQEAIDSINYTPTQGTKVTILIDEGTYTENIFVKVPYVSLQNSGKGDVLITALNGIDNQNYYNDFFENYGMLQSGTVNIAKSAVGFTATGITFQNTHYLENNIEKTQWTSTALTSYTDKVMFENCKFIGGQNTLYLGGASQGKDIYGKSNQSRVYLKDCYIEGTNDFVIGDATAVFDNCKLNMLYSERESSYIAANTTLFNVGHVFLNCTFTVDKKYYDSANGKANIYLGKSLQSDHNYRNYGSNIVLIKCKIPSYLNSEIWNIGSENTVKNKVRFMEYSSVNESSTSINLDENRQDWVIKLTQEQAQAYTVHNILRGNDGWNPAQDGKLSNPIKVAGITIDKYNIELPEGETDSIKAMILPINSDNDSIIFSSSDESIVTVDENGNITANKSGNAKVIATSVENKFNVSTNVSVISNRTEVPQVKNIDIKNFKTETGKIENIYPGDILTGVYNYVLATDDKIDNAKVKWYTIDSKTGEEMLIQEGRESFNKEYTVTSADVGCKIKFVVVPETQTNYGNYGKAVSYTTEVEVSKPDYVLPKVYLKENFSNFYERKYNDLNSNKYPTEMNTTAIWNGTNNSNDISWNIVNIDNNDMILGKKDSSTPSLLEYSPKEGEKLWKDVSISTRIYFNLENRTALDDAYYDIYAMYNGKDNSYYKLRFTKGDNLSSLKMNLYKKSGISSKETLIASENEKLTDIIEKSQGENGLWCRVNISVKGEKISVKFSFEDKRVEPIVLTVVDNEPLSQGYIAFESYKSSILLDSVCVEELISNAVDTNSNAVTVFIAGDSDSATYGEKRTSGGWGEYIQNYFDKSKVRIINKAKESKSSRNFINQGYFNETLSEIKQGDYLLIQFGYIDSIKDEMNRLENYVPVGEPDSKGVYPIKEGKKIPTPSELLEKNNSFYNENYYSSDSATFKWYLKQYIELSQEKGAIPILVTPIARNNEQNNEYASAMKQIAEEKGIKCIDMFDETKKIYEKIGASEFDKLFDVDENGLIDKSHYSKYGASLIAQTLAESIKKTDIEIGKYVNSETNVIPKTDNLRNATLFIVGDSTACDYSDDLEYAASRGGWGTYISNYLNKSIAVKNLASAESNSKSFTTEENYNTLISTMDKGDYLFIQFGRNDLDIDAYGDKNTEGSFKYYLYNYYIKPALEKGVNIVLISPTATRNLDTNLYKPYRDSMKEISDELNIPMIDMMNITVEYYEKMGEEQSKVLQAIYNDNSKGDNGIDNEHLNQYGASVVAMLLAQEIKNTSCAIKNYIPEDAFTNADSIYIKRADYIVMLMRVLGKTQKPHTNFNDVSQDKYYSDAVGVAKEIGITNGDTNGNFKPEGYLSRQDMMVFTARALRQIEKLDKGDISILDKFTDLKYVDEYAKQDIADLVQGGIISGVDNRLDSEITLTKSQAASMILKIYNIK